MNNQLKAAASAGAAVAELTKQPQIPTALVKHAQQLDILLSSVPNPATLNTISQAARTMGVVKAAVNPAVKYCPAVR